ncbi:MAG: phosphatase [Ignavibacteria bacterium]
MPGDDASIFFAFENELFCHSVFKVSRPSANSKKGSLIFAAFLVIFFRSQSCEKDFEVVRISCVIFDLDGTLTHTNPLIFASFNHVTRRYLGKTFSPEEGAMASLFGPDTAEEAMNEFCAYYAKHHHALARLHEGVKEVLPFLPQHRLSLALFTGKGRRTTHITLEAFGLTPFFDAVVTGNDVVCHKPGAEGIEKILQQWNANPQETVMVGDSPADVQAARAVGVLFAAALWDSYAGEQVLASHPDVTFLSVADMHRWFRLHVNGYPSVAS